MRTFFSLLGMTVLVSCGPLYETRSFPLLSTIGFGAPGPSTAALQSQLTNSERPQDSPPLLLYGQVANEDAGILALEAENGAAQTWRSTSGKSVITEKGIVIGTRGFGDDLMGAQSTDVAAALARGNGDARRIHEYLNGEDQIFASVYTCAFATLRQENINVLGRNYPVKVITETCRSERRTFRNIFWITASGSVVQSRQWVSRGVGYVDLQLR